MENNKDKNIPVIPTVGILVFKDGKVLLVCHKKGAGHLSGVWGLPAGRFEEDESAREVAIRELREETGLVAEPEDMVEIPKEWCAVIERKDGPAKMPFKVFIASAYQGSIEESSETDPKWIDINKIKEYNLLPNVYEAVQEGLRIIGNKEAEST